MQAGTRARGLSQSEGAYSGSKLFPVRSMASASEVGVGTEGILAMRAEDMPSEDLGKKDSGLSDLKEGAEEEVEWTYPEGGLRAWLVVLVSPI